MATVLPLFSDVSVPPTLHVQTVPFFAVNAPSLQLTFKAVAYHRVFHRVIRCLAPRLLDHITQHHRLEAGNLRAFIAFARSPLGGAVGVMSVLPPWLWTSTEIELRRTPSAAAAVSALCAASVEPRGPALPASIAPTETGGVLHTQGGGAMTWP